MKKQNKQSGITLVALVITIIILLILAGISISALTNQGLFTRAQEARNITEEKTAEENAILENYLEKINEITGGTAGGSSLKNVDKSKTDPESAIPSGVTEVIEDDAKKGIVIKDSKNNEWVWVEVPKYITADKATDSDIETALQTYAGVYRKGGYYQNCNWPDEWYAKDTNGSLITASKEDLTEEQKLLNNGCGLTYDEYNTAKHNMLQSIKTNGGFWISRYEAGIKGSETDTTKARTSHTDITDTSIEAVSQANMIPYNYVYCREAQTLAKRMSTDSSKTSSLLFGIQWDLVCKYLEIRGDWDIETNTASYYINENSVTWGNYIDSDIKNINPKAKKCVVSEWISAGTELLHGYSYLLTTGASEQTKKMNIYDFAGNTYEWTLEYSGPEFLNSCTARGGKYSDRSIGNAASLRFSNHEIRCEDWLGFRATLY